MLQARLGQWHLTLHSQANLQAHWAVLRRAAARHRVRLNFVLATRRLLAALAAPQVCNCGIIAAGGYGQCCSPAAGGAQLVHQQRC